MSVQKTCPDTAHRTAAAAACHAVMGDEGRVLLCCGGGGEGGGVCFLKFGVDGGVGGLIFDRHAHVCYMCMYIYI